DLWQHTAPPLLSSSPFSVNAPPTPELSPLPLHDALPISYYPPISRELRSCTAQRTKAASRRLPSGARPRKRSSASAIEPGRSPRSEEHTSELQSLTNLVCRLLLEKKKHTTMHPPTTVPPL